MVARRNTHQRELVLEAVHSLHNHPTANQVFEWVHARDEHVSMGTVYRNLNLLAETGEVLLVQAPGGNHYDFRTEDHSHVVCTNCGAVSDAIMQHNDDLDRTAEELSGYQIQGHYLMFEGLCPNCRKA